MLESDADRQWDMLAPVPPRLPRALPRSARSCPCMASAVSQASAAWACTSSGAFQNAMIASPMYLSMVPW